MTRKRRRNSGPEEKEVIHSPSAKGQVVLSIERESSKDLSLSSGILANVQLVYPIIFSILNIRYRFFFYLSCLTILVWAFRQNAAEEISTVQVCIKNIIWYHVIHLLICWLWFVGDYINDNSSPSCLFQALVEVLVGMKLSAVPQPEGKCITAVHQSSGNSHV